MVRKLSTWKNEWIFSAIVRHDLIHLSVLSNNSVADDAQCDLMLTN